MHLKFNPDYYRILTQEEIDQADLDMESYLRKGNGMVAETQRRITQDAIVFPASLDLINRDMLTEVNEEEDSDEQRDQL